MQLSEFDAYRKKKTLNQFACALLGLSLFHAVIFHPLYLFITNDVLFQGTVLALLFYTLSDLFSYVFFWVSFAFLVIVVTRFGTRSGVGLLGLFAGGMALYHALDILSGYLVMGFPSADVVLSDVLIGILLVTFLDACLFGASLLVLYLITAKTGKDHATGSNLFLRAMPPQSTLDFRNPMSMCALLPSVILGLSKIATRLYYDFAFIGAPQSIIDAFWMITYYLADLLAILLGYLLIQLMLNRYYMSEIRAKERYGEAEASERA
ncbi:MAG: hypothetical protein IKB75_03635 [Clostridia bacterium]|nr:hypothetical protein [Clostridia bacterium]